MTNGEMHYVWRAVDCEGEVLGSYVTKIRGKACAPVSMRKALTGHGAPQAIATDSLNLPAQQSLSSAMLRSGRSAAGRITGSRPVICPSDGGN